MALVSTGSGDGGALPALPTTARLPLMTQLAAAVEAERTGFFTWVPVFFGLGIAAYFWLPVEPAASVVAGVVVAACALWLALPRDATLAALAAGLVAATLGFAFIKVRTEIVSAPVLERRIGLAEVKGFVELIEPKPQRGGRITLRVASIQGLAPAATPKRVRVRTMGSLAGFKPGDGVKLKATLNPPAAPALPGAYDFARNAWYQGLGAVGYSLARPENDSELGEPPLSLRFSAAIERLRAKIGRRITDSLPGETGAIANALITGERGAITQKTNDAYRDSGLFHALSISGLHMAVMAGAIFWTLRLALACIPTLALRYPVKKWAAAGAALGALFYLMISGSSPPTERSYIMISIMFLAVMLDRQALALRNIALSALLILIVYPESLTDIGFQMSYTAVGALVAAHERIEALRAASRARGGIFDPASHLGRVLAFPAGIALSTIIASVAVAPFGAYYFHTSQQYAILGNVLGLPICDVYVMPLALAVLVAMPFGLEAWPLWAMGLGIDALTWVAGLVAALPGAVASVPAMPDAAFAAFVTGGIWLALVGTRWRLLGLVPIAAGIGLSPFGPRPDVLVSQDGQMVAARLAGNALSALPAKGRSFELARWLEHDGDARAPKQAASGDGFRCDASGCTARVKSLTLAVARRPSAFAEDCAVADIVVLSAPRPEGCTRPRLVLDSYALMDHGTHALYVESAGRIRVETVAGARGARPWSQSGLGKPPAVIQTRIASRGAPSGSRLEAFAAPRALIEPREPSSSPGDEDAADPEQLDATERAADERR